MTIALLLEGLDETLARAPSVYPQTTRLVDVRWASTESGFSVFSFHFRCDGGFPFTTCVRNIRALEVAQLMCARALDIHESLESLLPRAVRLETSATQVASMIDMTVAAMHGLRTGGRRVT
jgi:hypothetical protein